MELDLVDYSEDLLENVNIWQTPHSVADNILPFYCNLSATIEGLPSISRTSYSTVTFLEPPPIWLFPPSPPQSLSPSTFVSACLHTNPEVASSQTPLSSHPGESSSNPLRTHILTQEIPQVSIPEASPSGSYATILPLSELIPAIELPRPETPDPNPNHSGDNTKDPEVPSQRGKKRKCFKVRSEDFILRLEEDIQWGDTMDTMD